MTRIKYVSVYYKSHGWNCKYNCVVILGSEGYTQRSEGYTQGSEGYIQGSEGYTLGSEGYNLGS